MLLVKKCNFFHFLFSVKMRLEIRFNNVLDRKKSLFDYEVKIFQSPKNRTHAIFFLYLFPVKIRLEKRFNNVLDKKKPSFWPWKQNFSTSQKSHFSKGVNPYFRSKNAFFFLDSFSVKKGLEIRSNDVLDRKETFLDYRNKIFQRLKNRIFRKGLTHVFSQKMPNFSLIRFGWKETSNNA